MNLGRNYDPNIESSIILRNSYYQQLNFRISYVTLKSKTQSGYVPVFWKETLQNG